MSGERVKGKKKRMLPNEKVLSADGYRGRKR